MCHAFVTMNLKTTVANSGQSSISYHMIFSRWPQRQGEPGLVCAVYVCVFFVDVSLQSVRIIPWQRECWLLLVRLVIAMVTKRGTTYLMWHHGWHHEGVALCSNYKLLGNCIRECSSTPYVGMTHPLNINNDRLTSLFLRMEDPTQCSTWSLGSSTEPDSFTNRR